MAKPVYSYFPVKALGEAPRLLMTYGGLDFEDRRVTPEDWPALKPTTPFGQMPVLEMDGKVYSQSVAMSRYFGRKFGLSGADLEEDFKIDEIVDFINDIRAKAAIVQYEADEAIKKKKHEDFSQNFYPILLQKLTAIVEKNNGHVALGRLTWGDFVLAGMYDYLKVMMQAVTEVDEKYPALKKLVDSVYALPQLQAYLAKTPKTDI